MRSYCRDNLSVSTHNNEKIELEKTMDSGPVIPDVIRGWNDKTAVCIVFSITTQSGKLESIHFSLDKPDYMI